MDKEEKKKELRVKLTTKKDYPRKEAKENHRKKIWTIEQKKIKRIIAWLTEEVTDKGEEGERRK